MAGVAGGFGNDLVEDFSGANKFQISWYVDAPQALNSIARCFVALVMSFAAKNCCKRSVYDNQSSRAESNSPTMLNEDIAVYPRRQNVTVVLPQLYSKKGICRTDKTRTRLSGEQGNTRTSWKFLT